MQLSQKMFILISSASLGLAGCQNVGPEASGNVAAKDVAVADLPDDVYWGDLHVHSNLSFDSNSFGNRNLGPEAAYRFARGEEVETSSGQRAKLSRPLDFLMVADHAEYLGFLTGLQSGSEQALSSALGKRWRGYLEKAEGMGPIMSEYVDMVTGARPQEVPGKAFTKTVWNYVVDVAERYNDAGKFTAFAGYEWTSMPGGRNMHRVVVFRDGPEKTKQIIPFSALESDDPERLWEFLDQYERATKGNVLAIAHNGNLSGGLMFGDATQSGKAFTADYAKTRMRWEPVYEVTQVKGDGEAHPLLSPDDEFADFETWDETDISLTPKPKDPVLRKKMLEGEYARSGLKKGLSYKAKLGENPYQFGLMGSTDTHTALSTSDDNNFWGKFKDSEPSAERSSIKMGHALWPNAKLSASGYSGIWARANTRQELFDAIKRREIYATTGPRIKLRLFAGWDFAATDLKRKEFAKWGYSHGVPMGGMLYPSMPGRAPTFLVKALKDPEDVNLQRVQIVKGWRTAKGDVKEHVYDVALAKAASGEPELSVFWSDPDFKPEEYAFYYVRVIQMPTKRWTTYDSERYKVKISPEYPAYIQERVYSSPVWYEPDRNS
ncbi:DUF3604 domain-containing protein [Parasphingorhabdus sp.]|uniref:DUF3604 domain-containing protein n=1 Tax=Parasphingorhabdus sp. TaxID=2709688 RepID=UPI003A950F2E